MFLPEVLFAKARESGIDPAALPHHLDAQLPVERARYASMPGGAPNAEWLMARPACAWSESAPIAVDAVAKTFDGDVHPDGPRAVAAAASVRVIGGARRGSSLHAHGDPVVSGGECR